MDDHIRKILDAALQAPSGENSQPWLFKVRGNSIEHYHDPQSDVSLYNYKNQGSYVAHGAAIENMRIAAAALGYQAAVSVFPTLTNIDHIATIVITPARHEDTTAQSQRLYAAIPKRTSNRKPYIKGALQLQQAEALLRASQISGSLRVQYHRIHEREKMQQLAVVGATNEEIMLQNKLLHQFFFSHLTWDKEEDAQKKVGFYIKTLELPPPAQILFKILQNRSATSFLSSIGLPRVVRIANTKTNAAASEYGVITASGEMPEDFVYSGQLLERIWLAATAEGLQMQVLTGTIYLARACKETPHFFSQHQRSLLDAQMRVLHSMLDGKRTVVTCMFRVGYGDAPTARATKYTIEERLVE